MTYSNANIEFDKMDIDRKERVLDLFDALCRENILNVRDAFIAAVEDECKAIDVEMMLRQPEGAVQ
jgi:hypothetical protein